jgi:predicted nicotinamide N-methyase
MKKTPSHPLQNLEEHLKGSYHVKETDVKYLNRKLATLSIADLDELLDQVGTEEDIPFWAELWPSSIGLLEHFKAEKRLLTGRSILELGCGVGLVGLGVLLNGGNLTQSDYVPEALQFAAVNASRNGLSPARSLLTDWRNFNTVYRYDIICGADILYEKKFHSDLKRIFSEFLNSNGQIILADPGRKYADEFIQELSQEGWQCKTVEYPVELDRQAYLIRVHSLRLSALA